MPGHFLRKKVCKMDFLVVFQQMLALFAMIFIGYYVYRVHWVTQDTADRLSKILVNIFNPALLINGVLNPGEEIDGTLLLENLVYVFLYFALLIVISIPLVKLLRVGADENRYQLMFLFSNVGFMGIPVMRSIFGNSCIIFITFYILMYNILIYTLGILLAQKGIPKEQRKSAWKSMLNPGVFAAILAIVIFLLKPEIPEGAVTFFDYVGNAVIPLSMMIIGISIAQMPLKAIFCNGKLYIFSVIKLLLVPIVCAILLHRFAQTQMLFSIFILMLAMPTGSIVVMIAREYGGKTDREDICSKGILLTTLMSMLTIPIVTLFL